jgi:16S rRNA (cytidine1402-2'-O)-methyltransferase
VGTLYLVATPIGNLEDISARALRMLGHARLIAAEDTRLTRKLLTHFNLRTPVTSYYEHNKITKLGEILTELAQGDVALVSDAGTPALNDPGFELVRAALQAGHRVSPIPGPSAPLAALVASGLPTDSFLYLGYLPRKSAERRRLLSEVSQLPYTLIFLEAPHRLLASLKDLQQSLGDRQAAVARELTKLHEEIYRGTLSAAREHFEAQEPRGEFTLVIAGRTQEAEPWDEDRLHVLLRQRLSQGDSPSAIAAQVAGQTGWPRREVYRKIMDIQKE